jgi:hypothetical protein
VRPAATGGLGSFFGIFVTLAIILILLMITVTAGVFFRFFPAFLPLERSGGRAGQAQGLGQVGEKVLEEFRAQIFQVRQIARDVQGLVGGGARQDPDPPSSMLTAMASPTTWSSGCAPKNPLG